MSLQPGKAYQVRLMPVSTVPKTSTPVELLGLEELGMVPEQAVSASVAAAAARVSHLRMGISLPASIAGDEAHGSGLQIPCCNWLLSVKKPFNPILVCAQSYQS